MPLIVHDYTPLVDKEGKLGLADRLKGTFQYGLTWFQEIESQVPIIDRMKALFSDRFSLIRNYTLPESNQQVPFILIGPGGLRVITLSRAEGIFECRGEEWLEMNNNTREFEPAKPNFIELAVNNHRAVVDFMGMHDIDIPIHSPVLLFTNTGIDLTTDNPAARVVRMDALKRFLQSIALEEGDLNKLDINHITQIFERATRQKKKSVEIVPEREPLPNPFRNFSTMQWLIVGGILVLNIILILLIIALSSVIF